MCNRAFRLMLFFLCSTPLLASSVAHAAPLDCQEYYADKRVRFIIPGKPGRNADRYSRLTGPYFEKYSGAKASYEYWSGGKGLIGANKVANAKNDGLTIGIVNAPTLLMHNLIQNQHAPDLLTDMMIYSRIAIFEYVMATRSSSDIKTINDFFNADTPPLLAALHDRQNYVLLNRLMGEILDYEYEILTGLKDNNARMMALIRGDADYVMTSFSNIKPFLDSGEMQPILQIATHKLADDPILDDVPLLFGPTGIAAKRLRDRSSDVAAGIAKIDSATAFSSIGYLFVGPDVPENIDHCMQKFLTSALTDPGLALDAKKLGAKITPANREQSLGLIQQSQTILKQLLL